MPGIPRNVPRLTAALSLALTGAVHSGAIDFSVEETAEAAQKVMDLEPGDVPDREDFKPSRVIPVRTAFELNDPLWEPDELNWEAAQELVNCSNKCEIVDQNDVPGYEGLVGVDCEDSWAYTGPVSANIGAGPDALWILVDPSIIEVSEFLLLGRNFDFVDYMAEWSDEMSFDENLDYACEMIADFEREEAEYCFRLDSYLDDLELLDLQFDREKVRRNCGIVTEVPFSVGLSMNQQSKGLECQISLTNDGEPTAFWCTEQLKLGAVHSRSFYALGREPAEYLPSRTQLQWEITDLFSDSPLGDYYAVNHDFSMPLLGAEYSFEDEEYEEGEEEYEEEKTSLIQDTGGQFDGDSY